MAELHVQTKKQNASGSLWIWIVLGLIVVGAAVYYFVHRNKSAGRSAPPAHTTGFRYSTANPFSLEAILQREDVIRYFC